MYLDLNKQNSTSFCGRKGGVVILWADIRIRQKRERATISWCQEVDIMLECKSILCQGPGKNSQSCKGHRSTLEQCSESIQELWRHTCEPGTAPCFRSTKDRDKPRSLGRSQRRLIRAMDYSWEAVDFSGTYRNKDCVFWRVQIRADW